MPTTINGTTGVSKVQNSVVTDGKLNLTANSASIKTALNAYGSAPIYACRAWVNFNGTGTVAIRASGNVSSITDNGVGCYTVNFTTPMVDGNYSAFYDSSINSAVDYKWVDSTTITSVTVLHFTNNSGYTDPALNFVAIFR